MEVKLLDHTKLSNAVIGTRTCYDSFSKGGNYDIATDDITEADKNLLNTLINIKKHSSICEHIVYIFNIKGISRLVLQELARHRIASYSVKSSRYTLKSLAKEIDFTNDDFERVNKYINLTGNSDVDYSSIMALENLRLALRNDIKTDIAKYCLPECWKVDLVWTINMRSLINFLELRLANGAHFEIRELANHILKTIPQEHLYLYERFLSADDERYNRLKLEKYRVK